MALLLKGTGSALPEKIVTNKELASIVDTSDEWISERTGIKSRHISTGETVASLAAEAAKKALTDAGVQAEDVEIIIVASCSSEMALPCVACQVQSIIGANKAVAFDLNAACAGFLFAMNTVDAYISAGIYKNALVVGAEVLSNIIDWEDRGTCILFGDGAGAAYFEGKEGRMCYVQRSDGFKGDVLACRQRSPKNAFYTSEDIPHYVTMDGREVFKFATRQVPEAICEMLNAAKLEADDIDLYVLHQANLRIIESISKRLRVDLSKFPTNVERVGNTSSASIPLLLDELNRDGKLSEGMRVVLSGFGAGLTYSACLLEL
ncbi:MAG: ketoacyl-ACP synthase III [Lachnospiraceae bacterium]|nr:ketoacyl-ACP synthase III [Candidatus Colinaster scatohippi]